MLCKGEQLLKFIAKCRHRPSVRVNFSINMEFLENKIGEITARESLIAILESVNGVQKIESGALIIVSNYILILIWRKIYIYLIVIVKMRKASYPVMIQHFFKKVIVVLTGKLCKISLLQYFPFDLILSSAICKCSLYGSMPKMPLNIN